MKFFIKNFFSKCDQIRRKMRILSHLLKKSIIENFIFCAVKIFLPPLPILLEHLSSSPLLFDFLSLKMRYINLIIYFLENHFF